MIQFYIRGVSFVAKYMTIGESSCLISFAWAPLSCSKRVGSEKFEMKIYVSSGIRTHTRHSTAGKSARRLDNVIDVLQDSGIQINKTNTCQIDYGYEFIWTACQN